MSPGGKLREDPRPNVRPLGRRFGARRSSLLTAPELGLPRLVPASVGRTLDAGDELRGEIEALLLREGEGLVEELWD